VENIPTEKQPSTTPQRDASLLKKLLKKFPKKESVKNVKTNSNSSLYVVRIESIHPGDAYYKKGHEGMTGIWTKERDMISNPIGWLSGYFIPIDILINPSASVIFLIGVKVKRIKYLTAKELLFWEQILNERKP
jgi:hypothetical protein